MTVANDSGEFDFIVVGAGSAGCPVAARLSEVPEHRVLLVEAGGRDDNLWLHIPFGFAKVFGRRQFNWIYRAEPEPGLGAGAAGFYQGKVLGGSSAVNGMVHTRGQPEDYDAWARAGIVGWGWQDVLPFFRKLEDQAHGEDAFHGVGGPVHVGDQRESHPLCEAFFAAAAEAGIPRNRDFNGPAQEGAGYYQVNARRGRRISAATAYLRPARRRGNLRVETGVQVERVIFEGRRAAGVECTQDGVRRVFRARREVILSAGGLGSPLMLQRSGIGPAALLQRHGIAVRVDAPAVGRDLRNQFNPWISYRCKQRITINDVVASRLGRARIALQYALFRRGYMAWGPIHAGAFFKTDPALDRPDMMVHLCLFAIDPATKALAPFPGITVSVLQMRPESSGFVAIGGPSLADRPTLQFNYLAVESDRLAMSAGLRVVREVMRQPALAPYIADEVDAYPDLSWSRDNERVELRGTVHHLTTSCRMGIDAASVVDPRLRVRGVAGLRVADASIFPAIISGGTHAPAMMVGEKAAHMILEDARSGG